ncbi:MULTISPECIES: biopolymer transporter ExbD [Acinetobacter]|uniref:Biopolymer transporter ExbD n=1 Tax=Acinetobacter pseudolwoffii TaxID=2053287 RepID=A0A2H9UNF7_9GAMM|nr:MULTISPECIES: biopolymer transporter ExbD [Acinetobacter]MCP0911817.1 biopolymer transporter ExbD [Acinetobacter pseudolwoffii]MDM1344752.1 biopolymer transporter ExbD [Acinetobacter pseudolwoffii]PJI33231.1 biopolymer transporter ExbD [Acinetobacter pseudolwoffii]PJI36678.1 biopolymer transporter ExbD [Acinetobacter pseudolwoffii]HJE53066.1 biopolymer transporter ExbD [Acinetobacter pseudolwoffii]
MGMMVNSNDSDDDEVIGTINTTPLVDIMLVLLIIFLITVPVAIHTVPVDLPEERNVPYETKPDNVQLAVNKTGDIFWNEIYIADKSVLLSRLQAEAQKTPQPEVHIRGDQLTPYEAIDQVISTTQQAGIGKIAFVTTPPATP